MKTQEVTLSIDPGLSSKYLCDFIYRANAFQSQILIEHSSRRVSAKSLLGLMTLNLKHGTTVQLFADGCDEAEAVRALSAFLSGDAPLQHP